MYLYDKEIQELLEEDDDERTKAFKKIVERAKRIASQADKDQAALVALIDLLEHLHRERSFFCSLDLIPITLDNWSFKFIFVFQKWRPNLQS